MPNFIPERREDRSLNCVLLLLYMMKAAVFMEAAVLSPACICTGLHPVSTPFHVVAVCCTVLYLSCTRWNAGLRIIHHPFSWISSLLTFRPCLRVCMHNEGFACMTICRCCCCHLRNMLLAVPTKGLLPTLNPISVKP